MAVQVGVAVIANERDFQAASSAWPASNPVTMAAMELVPYVSLSSFTTLESPVCGSRLSVTFELEVASMPESVAHNDRSSPHASYQALDQCISHA